jgi:hypothetical protein
MLENYILYRLGCFDSSSASKEKLKTLLIDELLLYRTMPWL